MYEHHLCGSLLIYSLARKIKWYETEYFIQLATSIFMEVVSYI